MYEYILFIALTKPPKPAELPVYKCTRWTWSGDVYNRKVVCLEWQELDCRNRLHKNICKLGVA